METMFEALAFKARVKMSSSVGMTVNDLSMPRVCLVGVFGVIGRFDLADLVQPHCKLFVGS